ncbi:MAG: VCBS repeat-containing protein [Planctomycetaceae bacterium]|nr:VCBS repeat-containing protein [Planctomycetaceae bacterium]
MSWFCAPAARLAVEMRRLTILSGLALAAEMLCAIGAAADEFSRGDAPAWHLSVIDLRDGKRIRPTSVADAPVQPVSARSSWETAGGAQRAQWSLQLGMVRPPHVFRTQFGSTAGIPLAGDFNGDGFTELAMFIDGRWYIDLNGNSTWDRDDAFVAFGRAGDRPVVGDWNQDGKDDIAVVSYAGEKFESAFPVAQAGFHSPTVIGEPGLPHPLNALHGVNKSAGLAVGPALGEAIVRAGAAGAPQATPVRHAFRFGGSASNPIVGDWGGTGVVSIGAFDAGVWTLDVDGDGRYTEADQTFTLGEAGDIPVVGDFNRDGRDDLGVYRRGAWIIDTNGDRRFDANDLTYQLGDDGDTPVVGDWDGDGRDQIGIVHRS